MEEHVRKPKINDKEAYLICCAETCFNADEALALEGDNKFNKVLLSHQLAQIEILQECPKIETGEFQFKYVHGTERTAKNVSGVKWVPGNNGLVHILEHPVWEGNSENLRAEMNNLYVAGIDSIDIGQDQTSDATKNPSKFAIIIKKRALGLDSPKYVAYYKYRPRDEREAYETAMKLMIYYNCKANIEATRLTMLNWAKTRGWTNYFMRRPKATYADAHRKISNTIGTPATTPIINHQTDLIAQYIEDYSQEIWFPEILHEFLRYSDATKGEFDLTAAAGMVELADEELSGVVPTNVEKEEESTWKEIGYYKDEQGVTHWGVISKNNLQSRARISTEIEDNRLYGHSSDPRYYE